MPAAVGSTRAWSRAVCALALGLAAVVVAPPAGAATQTLSTSNTALITINDDSAATPYPSTIAVAGQAGTISKATVTLTGFSHTCPWDVSVLLVGPGGQQALLMSRLGPGLQCPDSSNADLTFDDDAAASVPYPPVTGTWKPTEGSPAASFPSPAPAGPYPVSLSGFAGTGPNGTWSLYVVDSAGGDTGTIAGGWTLNLELDQPAASVTPATVSFGEHALGSTAEQQITVTNVGSSPLTVGLPSITGSSDLTIVDDECASAVLAPAAACTITVGFTPTAAGAHAATLVVPSDDPAGDRTVALDGTGVTSATSSPPTSASTSTTSHVYAGVTVTPTFTG